jgi:hypothetical protein
VLIFLGHLRFGECLKLRAFRILDSAEPAGSDAAYETFHCTDTTLWKRKSNRAIQQLPIPRYFFGGAIMSVAAWARGTSPLQSAGKTAALEDGFEAGFGTEGIPFGIHSKEDKVEVVSFDGTVEPV